MLDAHMVKHTQNSLEMVKASNIELSVYKLETDSPIFYHKNDSTLPNQLFP